MDLENYPMLRVELNREQLLAIELDGNALCEYFQCKIEDIPKLPEKQLIEYMNLKCKGYEFVVLEEEISLKQSQIIEG